MSEFEGSTTVRVRARKSSLVATLIALLAFGSAVIAYYVCLGVVALFEIPASLGSASMPDPAGFSAIVRVILYGGPVWGVAAAIFTFRRLGPEDARLSHSRGADLVIVLGVGLMGSVLGMLPALLAPEDALSTATMFGAVLGFALSAGLMWLIHARARVDRRREVPLSSAG